MAVYRPKFKDPKTGKLKRVSCWWISFTLLGKRVRESAKTTKKTIASEYLKQRRQQLERALAGLPSEERGKRINSVADMVKPYLEHYGLNHRPKSARIAQTCLGNILRHMGGALLPNLTEDRIRGYIKTRLDEGVGGRTVNMELGELSRALGHKWSVLWPKVRKLQENHDVGRALSPEEEARLLEHAGRMRSPLIGAFVRALLLTGMRAGEITSLTWGQVDFENRIVTVGKAKSEAGRGRQIPMNPQLLQVLSAHGAWFAHRFGELRPEWFLFPWGKGQAPTDPTRPVTDLTTAWDALREAAGVRCRLHDLRHTFCTKLAEAGVAESTMMSLMGHMSRAMLERYSHIRIQAKRVAVEAVKLADQGETSAVAVKESAQVCHVTRVN